MPFLFFLLALTKLFCYTKFKENLILSIQWSIEYKAKMPLKGIFRIPLGGFCFFAMIREHKIIPLYFFIIGGC